jgi:hypothetical protein
MMESPFEKRVTYTDPSEVEVVTTIKQYIIDICVRHHAIRLAKLEALDAPSVMIDGERALIERWRGGTARLGDKEKLLDTPFVSIEWRKGRGGKEYAVFNDSIAYFPKGRFGPFVMRLNPKDK